MELQNKTVLITGASSGIGKATAKAFLEKGARVIVFGLHKPDYDCEFHKVDVSKEEEIKQAFEKIKSVDVLINNAGIAELSALEKTSSESMNRMVDVNFKGVFWMSKYAISKINSNGCIINIASICAFKNFEGYGIYSATKAAVVSITKTLALELAERKIRVNAISPGATDTPIWEKMYDKDAKEEMEETGKSSPSRRVGKPEEIANAAVFICENDFLNGENLIIDGGLTI